MRGDNGISFTVAAAVEICHNASSDVQFFVGGNELDIGES